MTIAAPQDSLSDALALRGADTLFERVDLGLGILDRELRFVRVNARLAAINGRPIGSHLGRRVREVLGEHPLVLEVEGQMRAALRGGAPVRGVELCFPDRNRSDALRWLVCDYLPIPAGADAAAGGIAVVVAEHTERRAAELALAQSEARLRHVLDAVGVFTLILSAEGFVLDANAPALAAANLTPADVRGLALADTYWFAGDPGVAARAREAAERAAAGEASRYQERLRVGPARTMIADVQVSPVREAFSAVTRIVVSALDVTDMVEAREHYALLAGELNHRVKNILAVVGALVTQTARRAPSKEALAAALQGRIAAMAKAVALLSRSQWTGFGLGEVLAEQMEAHGRERFTAEGPALPLGPKAALGFALLIHELATNAIKHGALSRPEGRVDVAWTFEGEALLWRWTERGGPPVAAPDDLGFGMLLIRNVAEGDLGAALTLDYEPGGLRAALRAPLRRVRGARAAEQQGEPGGPARGVLHGARVLVVEDSAIIALDIASTLEAAGAVVVGPAGGVEAALALAREALAEKAGLQAAILDLDLGGASSAPVRALLAARGVPAVLAAAQADAEAGAEHALLAKPFTEAELIRALTRALSGASPA